MVNTGTSFVAVNIFSTKEIFRSYINLFTNKSITLTFVKSTCQYTDFFRDTTQQLHDARLNIHFIYIKLFYLVESRMFKYTFHMSWRKGKTYVNIF